MMPESNLLKFAADTEERLRADAACFRLLAENVDEYAVVIMDVDANVQRWTAGAERIMGWSEAEVVGRPGSIIFTPEDREMREDRKEIESALKNGKAEDQRWHVRKDGSRFWGFGVMTLLRDEGGIHQGYAKILRDLTARKLYEQQVENLNERLKAAIAETNHRVKNNLQVIAALMDLTVERAQKSVPVEEVRLLANHLRSMAAIHDILTKNVEVDPDAMAVSSRATLEKLLPVVANISDRRTVELNADDVALPVKQISSLAVIVNELVTNALKYSRDSVRVGLRVRSGEANLTVTDDGPGFPEGFDSRAAGGAGLELVRTIAEWDLRGRVAFENDPNGGARVTVTFAAPS